MKFEELTTSKQLLERELRDPEFRTEWERTALARAIAIRLVAYRAEHELSQTQLAEKLRMKQPAVARLERGDQNPMLETLLRIVDALQIEIVLNVRPRASESKLVTKRAERARTVETVSAEQHDLLVVAN